MVAGLDVLVKQLLEVSDGPIIAAISYSLPIFQETLTHEWNSLGFIGTSTSIDSECTKLSNVRTIAFAVGEAELFDDRVEQELQANESNNKNKVDPFESRESTHLVELEPLGTNFIWVLPEKSTDSADGGRDRLPDQI